jgi:DNA polymerase III epsilon subunit-like protein
MKVVFFDTETTGLMPRDKELSLSDSSKYPHIVQFSCIVYDFENHETIRISDDIIQVPDGIVIPPESIQFHGITDVISREKGKPIREVLDRFVSIMDEVDLVIAHNMEFDLRITLVELVRIMDNAGLSSVEREKYSTMINKIINANKYYCSMKESIEICKIKAVSRMGKEYNKFPSLSELHKHYFGFVPSGLHNSLNDVVIGLRCFGKMRFDLDICDENEEMCNRMSALTNHTTTTKTATTKIEKEKKPRKPRKPRKRNSKKRNTSK